MVLVHELELGRDVEVAAGDGARAVDADGRGGLVASAHALEHQALDVQDDVGDVLVGALDGRELVLHAINLDGLDCRSLKGRQENAAKRVSEGISVATLQRLRGNAGEILGNLLDRHLRSDEFGHENLLPVQTYLE